MFGGMWQDRPAMKTILLLFLIISCGKRSALVFETPADAKVGTFKSLSANVLENKCFGCHKSFKVQDNMQKYINGNDPDTSKLFEVVKNGTMPKKAPPLTSLELEMVRAYIMNVEVIEKVSFQELKTQILDPKCISCHKKKVDEASIKGWLDVKSPFTSKLYLATKSGSMPKKAPHLTKEEMMIIKGYLKSFKF
jgi:hypothetical protein